MAELATQEPQQQPTTPQQPAPPAPVDESIDRNFQSVLDFDPDLLKKIDAVAGPSTVPVPASSTPPGLLSGLWQKAKDFAKANLTPDAIAHGFTVQGRQEQAQALLDTQKSAARGVVKGVNELSNTAVSAAVGLDKKTGLYKVGRAQDQQDAFLKWWEQPTAKANPLQFPEDQLNKWVGPAAPGTLNGLVENGAQFATGLAAATEMLPNLPSGAKKLATAGYNLLKAGVADATAFDPHVQRISNIIQNHLPPDSKFHALTYLASKTDDSEALGRFKASMEGLVLTSTIEALSGGLGLLKAQGDPEAMAKVVKQTTKNVQAASDAETAGVVPTEDGRFAVVLKGPDAEKALTNITDTGFAQGAGDATVQVPPGQAIDGADNTVAVMQRAQRIAGPDEFRKLADAEVEKRGVKGNPDGEKAAIEETARKVVANHENFAANVESSVANVTDAQRQEAKLANPPQPPEPFTEKPLPPAQGEPSADALLAYSDQHNVPVQTALRAFQQAGNDVPDEMAKEAFSKHLLRESPTYSTQGEAEGVAAVFDKATKNEKLAAGSVDPEMVNGWKKAFAHYNKTSDARGALDILDTYGVNLKYNQTPEELLNVVKALVDEAPEASTVARGRPHTWAEVSKEAADLADGMGMEPDAFIRRSASIFGSTQGLDTRMRYLKLVLWKHSDEVSKIARAAVMNPDNALAQDQLASGLDAMLELHSYYTGAKSEIGRALNIEKMPVGDAAKEAADRAPSPEVSPEETQAAADATGGTPEKPIPETPAQEPASGGDNGQGRILESKTSTAGAELDAANQSVNDRIYELATGKKRGATEANPSAPAKSTLKTTEGDAGGATLGPSQTPSTAGAAPYTDPYQFVNRAPPTRSATAGLTREEIRSLANSVFMAEGDPNEILTLLRGPRRVYAPPAGLVDKQGWFGKAWNFIHAYRMNAMLSGPKTQIANSISNTIMMLQRPLEYWMAGASTFNPELRQMGADMLGGMSRDLGESWTAARKSFLKGDNVLDPSGSPIQSAVTSWGDATFLQKLFGAPSRMLMSADEFYKQMNYRANLRAQILRQARSQGVTDSDELAKRLTDEMQFGFDPNGGGVNPIARQYSQVSTFTNDLGDGTIGRWIQEGANKHPLIRTIFPFVRTTTQIFRAQWQRTPVLNMLNREFREDFMAGGERRALAIAKTEMGTAMYGTAGMLAATGQITGAGPTDPELRQQMKATGWQPYSIKIPGTNRYVSYRRIDPTFAAFGLVADAVQIDSELADSDRQNVASAIIASIMSNLGSKTYMQGLTDFTDAMSSADGQKVNKLLEATATSFEPNVLRQVNPDDTIRETRGLVDEFMARTPGFSTKLEPRRNLFGEKILLAPGIVNRAFNPMTLSGPVGDGDVASELVRLGKAFSMPATTKYNGQIDLTNRDLYDNGSHQSPYDRMLELMGKPKDGEPSLRQQMEAFVKSDDYRNASEDKYVNQGGQKWNLANGLIQGAQQKAWANVLEEYPKLQTAISQSGELQGASLDGGSASVKAALQNMDNVLVRLKRTPK